MTPLQATFTIQLTQNQTALVDERDWRRLRKHRWQALRNHAKSFYAVRKVLLPNGKQVVQYMHREILGLKYGDGLQVDHENHKSLDNRRDNLRIVTNRQNHENRRRHSQYGVGVQKLKGTGRFMAHSQIDGRRRHIGTFSTVEDAARARKEFLKGNSDG